MATRSKIAAQMFTLRDFTKTPADIAATCAKVRKIGFEAVQASALGPIEPEEFARILQSEGLTCCATHVGFEQLKENPQKVAEEHHLWGCQHTAVPAMPGNFRSAEGFAQFARELNALGKIYRPLGLTVSYHNHAFELTRYGQATGLEILYKNSRPSRVKAELDTYWIQYGGGDPAAWITRLGKRQPLVHLKDMGFVDDKIVMAEVGEGNLNWPAILKALKRVQTQWYIIEQDICSRDPFESLRISLEHLKAWGVDSSDQPSGEASTETTA